MSLFPDETIEDEQDLFSYSAEDDPVSTQPDPAVEGAQIVRNLPGASAPDANERFYLKTEAVLLQLAYANNKILSLSNSRTRILAHQVESTHRIVNALSQRFLIADEVGLGKTIEAGLVIKELIYRYDYKKILIVCPASLLYQWQNEMASKFNEHFLIMDRKLMRKTAKNAGEGGNPWQAHDRVICSIDFIKNRAFADDIAHARWDAVIFDEAHRLRRDSLHSTIAYTAAEVIARRTKSLLLLSATPFRGKLEELYYLIALMDPNLLGPFYSFYNDYCLEGADLSRLKSKISSVVIRRTKREVGGFTVRHARTVRFELYPDERELYDTTTTYVVEEFNRAMQAENRAVGFVMTVFQKLLDSSAFALMIALKKRRDRLAEMAAGIERGEYEMTPIDESPDPETLDENEDFNGLMEASLARTLVELKEEVRTLDRLVALAERIDNTKKGEKLKELLRGLRKKGSKKFLIFTQFMTTQMYLKDLLADFDVVIFNGSMDREEKEVAILKFKEDAEVLIATEAGGEGRNMQFCNILINYDLPWSPLKIEQRIGRVHRFGQQKDVLIYNFSTRDTVAERVLEVLDRKLKLFEDSIGTPDVLLGQIEDEINMGSLFMQIAGAKNRKAVDEDIDSRINRARQSFEKLSDLTVADRLDFNYDEYYEITLKERQYSNKRIEEFVCGLQRIDEFPDAYLGKKHPKNGLYPVRNDTRGEVRGRYGTFSSQTALENENLEFLAFGHPVVDSLIRYCAGPAFGGACGVRALRYHHPFTGLLCNYVVTYESVSRTRELIPVAVPIGGGDDPFLIEDIEQESLEQEYRDCAGIPGLEAIAEGLAANAAAYLASAGERLEKKVRDRIRDMSLDLDLSLDPELEKIGSSYDRRIKELEEKLQIQEGQMKWYGKDMKGALTRTQNKIAKARRERDNLLETYRAYRGVRYSVTLLNAGIVATRPEVGI